MSEITTRPVHVVAVRAIFDRRADGLVYVRSREPLGEYDACATDALHIWAAKAPSRIFLAQRNSLGEWQTVTYAQALTRVKELAAGLLGLGLSESSPLIILSGNSVEHGLLALAAMYAGIPYAPIAPAYSLEVREFTALDHVWQNLRPGAVFVQDGARFMLALRAVMREPVPVIYQNSPPDGIPGVSLSAIASDRSAKLSEDASRKVTPETIAKILYTSGSTGLPKGVITTHRMLCSNQQMLRQVMPCLAEEPPVLCDWLPWNHTFGGSHNFGIALFNGGTLYIDNGKPTANRFRETLQNLREIATTAYFNVPRGYEMLVAHLSKDAALRERFFSRLHLLFFAAAGLNHNVWDELQRIAVETCGQRILVVTGLGATESAPFALSTGIDGAFPGWIGLPVPGVELKLAPVNGRMEARLRGPSITPGYWRAPELNAAAFDEEKFYRMGDAIRIVDPDDVQKGFVFDGRLNEDFKLSSGTWVRAGALRMRLLAHFGGLVHDVVFAGPDRDYVIAMFFPEFSTCHALCPDLGEDASATEILSTGKVRRAFLERLQSFAALNPGNSTRVERAVILDVPPSMEAREVTDKGSINQSAVLRNRADLVESLYLDMPPKNALVLQETTV
jgi:feruloyl-CoA synthase